MGMALMALALTDYLLMLGIVVETVDIVLSVICSRSRVVFETGKYVFLVVQEGSMVLAGHRH